MKRTSILMAATAAVFLSTGATAALDLSLAAFYSPGLVTGEAAEVKEFALGGFKGRVSLGVYGGLNLALGFGYNDFVYREEPPVTFPVYPGIESVLSIPILITTLGADYAFPIGFLHPYLGGGAVLARETAEAHEYETVTVDWYGGLYGEGGARYFLGESWAVEAGPRYTLLFDKPVIAYDGRGLRDFERSENRSRLLEFLVGVNYYF